MKNSRLLGLVVCAVIICLVLPFPGLAKTPRNERDDEGILYKALLKVESSAKLWAGEGYGEIYIRFSQALSAAKIPYERIVKAGPSGHGGKLLAIYEDYTVAHEFLQAYLNDKALIMRTNRFFEPTYLIKRDAWPTRLERRFPGLIAAINEEDNNGEFIEGRRALDFIFSRIHDELQSVNQKDAFPSS